MVVGTTSEILVEDGHLGIKEVCQVSEFRSFQCNHNTYGLCLGLVLSGKPHRGTNIWRFLARLDPAGRGAAKGRLHHGVVCNRNWSWIVGKVRNLSRVKPKYLAVFSEFRSFQCNHNTYGLCLGLVLSGKPHLGTNIWRFLARLDPEGRGATKGKPRHGLVCKRTWSWIVGKVHKLSRVLQSDRSAVFTVTEQQWASEGWSL